MIKALPPLQKNEEYVSYDVDSLFTNIPLKETIDYIIHKIYNEKFLKPICKKLIQAVAVQIDNTLHDSIQRFYKQIDGCAMGGPLLVILADIHMVRTENEVVKPMNRPLYKRFVDDIYNKRNKSQEDVLFEALDIFHPNIKLTVDVNPENCWDIKIILNNEGVVARQVYWKEITKLYFGFLKFRKDISKTLFQGICIDLEKQHQISTSKSEQSK